MCQHYNACHITKADSIDSVIVYLTEINVYSDVCVMHFFIIIFYFLVMFKVTLIHDPCDNLLSFDTVILQHFIFHNVKVKKKNESHLF